MEQSIIYVLAASGQPLMPTTRQQKVWYWLRNKRFQILNLPKSHANDAVAIACSLGEVVKPSGVVHQIRCIARGHYQLYNGKRSEHRVWAPRKVKGWRLYEVVEAKGRVGSIGGRRVKGAFVITDLSSGKPLVEVAPGKLKRLARPSHGWLIWHHVDQRKEERASSSV